VNSRAQTAQAVQSNEEIEAFARKLLDRVGVYGKPPTPEAAIIAVASLVKHGELDLEAERASLLKQFGAALISGLKKIQGLLDLRERVIFVTSDLHEKRKPFVAFHEVGHSVIPWQRDVLCRGDDNLSLSPNTKQLFEAEANSFAANLIFQVDAFDNEAKDCSFAIQTPILLADRYGASYHSALRRYVERHESPCALLILGQAIQVVGQSRKLGHVRYIVSSKQFKGQFGHPEWPHVLGGQTVNGRVGTLVEIPRAQGQVLLRDLDGNERAFLCERWTNQFETFLMLRPIRTKRKLFAPRIVLISGSDLKDEEGKA